MASGDQHSEHACRVAVKCLCGILDAVPHFNYMSDVLQVLVPKLDSADGRARAMAAAAVSTLLRRGLHGDIMLETVQLVSDLVRTKKCVCHPDAVQCLLVLGFQDIDRDDVAKGAAAFRPCFMLQEHGLVGRAQSAFVRHRRACGSSFSERDIVLASNTSKPLRACANTTSRTTTHQLSTSSHSAPQGRCVQARRR